MNRLPLLYLDTSALLRLYLLEPETPFVKGEVERSSGVVLSALSMVEARSALAQRRQNKQLTGRQYTALLADLEQDERVMLYVDPSRVLLKAAGELCQKYGGLRALDAIHVVTVQAIGLHRPVNFLTFDVRQRDAARLELGRQIVLENEIDDDTSES